MTIFVICRVSNPALVGEAVKSQFPNDHLPLQGDEWLVSAKSTAREIAERLGITEEEGSTKTKVGSAIVFASAGYWGRASTEIWEWLKTKSEATGGW